MKKLFFIFLLTLSLFAKVYHSLPEAKIKAKETLKPILLIVYSPTCPHCANYFTNMKNDSNVMRLIAENYVICILNVDTSNIPANIPFSGTVPFTEVLYFNGEPITPPLNGEIPVNYLAEYLYQSIILFNKILQSQYNY